MATGKALAMLCVLLAVAGCTSAAKKHAAEMEREALRTCPQKLVARVMDARDAVKMIRPGVTRFADVPGLGYPAKVAVLENLLEGTMRLNFYPTALPSCGFMPHDDLYTPVATRDGDVIEAVGLNDMRALHAKGWQIKGAAWPWQSYSYGYLPFK